MTRPIYIVYAYDCEADDDEPPTVLAVIAAPTHCTFEESWGAAVRVARENHGAACCLEDILNQLEYEGWVFDEYSDVLTPHVSY